MLISDQLDTIQKGIVQDVTVDVEVMVRDVYQEKCTLISGARAATKVYPFPVSDDIISWDHQLSWE